MKKPWLTLFCLFFWASTATWGQRVGVYNFENNFEESSGQFPKLKILGRLGSFQQEQIPQLDNVQRPVYVFDKNCGLQFDNRAANGFFNGSYTIEIYFRFSALDSWKRVVDFKNRKSDKGCYIYEGKLNFYDFAVGEKAPVKPDRYTHYVMSRNAATNQVKMYIDGVSKIEFPDKAREGVIDDENVLNFFYDDLIVKDEASDGAVALLKIYDYVVDPQEVKKNFADIKKTIQNPTVAVPVAPVASPPLPAAVTAQPLAPKLIENKPFKWEGILQNAANKQLISQATLLVLDSNMVELERKNITNGRFSLLLQPNQEYNFALESLGFTSVGLHFTAQQLRQRANFNNMFVLKPVEVGTHIELKNLYFMQSTAELLPESDVELARLLNYLRENPRVEIGLEGHTDNQGDFNLNLELSRKRVETVKAFLVKSGVAANRIVGRGFGASRPLSSNNREETRKLNRRVELVIKKY
jgi:OmpA-OmpF porin, OOP family